MRIVRYGPTGNERPGLVDENGVVRSLYPLLNDVRADMLTPEWLAALAAIDPKRLPVVPDPIRLGVPVAGIGQIIAIGLNYRDHAEETGMTIPDYPMVFAKSIASLAGSEDPIAIPSDANKLDWEVELAILIGTTARMVSTDDAPRHIAGYMTAVDVSERDWQLAHGGQFGKGKSFDGFTPVGPWLATADEIAPDALDMWLDVGDRRMQDGNTRDMIFSSATIVAHLSRYQTLLPGDLILTGTPAGVGHGMKPPRYLQVDELFRCGIAGLGEQRHRIVAID